jgi:bifunctional non-homologous end joining protein LigD
MTRTDERDVLTIGGREVAVTNPRKVLFREAGITKLDLVQYYLSVADGALRAAGGRPNVLVRYPNGIDGEFFYQKRAPDSRPDWIDVVALHFPSGRTAEEVVPRDAAALAWMANLACLELHPHPVRADDLDHPDELRVDLDPVPGVEWPQIQQVAGVVHAALDDLGLIGWPKTSGSRGVHVSIRIERRWTFDQVRRAALALARDVERRAPGLATSKWWKEERHGVFLDYNQNAKDRTVAGAYSVRPKPDARVSAPLTWAEIAECDPRDFTLRTMPARFAALGDRHAGIDDRPCSLEALLALSERDETAGLGDAPWPPHYRKQTGEPSRVAPSRARKPPTTPESTRANSRKRSTSASTTPESSVEAAPAAEPASTPKPTGRRTSTKPLLEIARARAKEDALAGLERWKARHPEAASHLEPADVLVDAMRGRFQTWTRIRVNLQHVPEAQRPPQEPLDPNEDPLTEDWEKAIAAQRRRRPSRARTES